MPCLFLLCTAFAGCLLAAVVHAKPLPTREGPDESPLLAGVWEEVSTLTEGGKLEETDATEFNFRRLALVWIGKKCYWIDSLAVGVRVSVFDAHFVEAGPGEALDFISPEDNRTIRCRYELKGDTWMLCWRNVKTATRPDKLAPTSDGVNVHVFKKLPGLVKRGSSAKQGLAGLWETVGYELNGVKTEEKNIVAFAKNQKAYLFADDFYTVLAAETGATGRVLRVVQKPYKMMTSVRKDAVDFTGEDDQSLPAIYKAENNTLTICWNDQGGARPDELRTENGDGRALLHLRRVDREPPRP